MRGCARTHSARSGIRAIDVFLRREDAFAALEDVLGDEPDWASLIYVAPIELDERNVSAN
jgi:hypothetical protein